MGTVSNALNHPEKLRPETLKLINETINRLGYLPNQSARQLAGGTTKSFGLVLPRLDHGFSLQIASGAHNEASRDAPYRLLLYAHPSPSEGMPLPQKILPHYRRVQQEAEKYAKRYPDKYVDPEEDRDPNETDEEAAVRDAEQKAATMSEEEIYEHLSQHLSQSQELHPPPAAPARIVETHPESHSSSGSRGSSSSEDDLLDSQPLPKKQHADGAPEQDVKSEKTKEAITASRFGAMSSSSSSSSENGSSSESDNAPSSFFTQESFFGF